MWLKAIFFCFLSATLTKAAVRKPKGKSYISLDDPLGLRGGKRDADDIKYNSTTGEPERIGWNYNYVRGYIWPIPQKEQRDFNTRFTLDPKNFAFHLTGEQSDVVIEALNRYKDYTFPDKNVKPVETHKQMLKLNVKVLQKYKAMELKTDESYTLIVDAPESTLTANTCWGALRGLESFSQLVYQHVDSTYWAQKNHIEDFPRFHHRGFMIDTSRHFVNIKFILQFIDAMAFSKFNVLHWHVTDDQSFPYVSQHFPQLHQRASRDPKKSVYTPGDVKRILDYGRMRGIRILPEFDTPGHVRSWDAIPDLLTPCYSGDKPNGYFGPINPTIEKNYVFLKEFFQEVGEVFNDPYLHLGGDEVYLGCWKSNPQITQWMKDHGMGKNYSLLEQYYEQKLLDIVAGIGKKYVVWQEVVDNQVKVKPDTVVNVWKGGWQNEMKKVTEMGFDTILSSCWYLNYISYGDDWHYHYKCDPHDFKGDATLKKKVIGGTACMWGEFVDGVNLISRSWGRGIFVGGRLWHAKEQRSFADAAYRTWEHRCRYLRRGLNADVIYGSQYCRHEYQND